MSKRDHLRACEARRDAILRAHECDATPTDCKVLDAVFWYLSDWDTLSAVVRLDNLAAVTFVIMPSEVQLWQRKRVKESLLRWDSWGIVRYSGRRGRPSKEQGGPAVEIGLILVTERHPVSKVLYRDVNGPDASKKWPCSDEKMAPTSDENGPTSTLKMQRVERSSEVSYEKPLAFRSEGVFTNAHTKSKGSTDESPETRVRRHLSERGYGKQTINRVVELLHEDVRNPEPWAESIVEKVAGEVDAMNARAVEVFHAEPVIPPELRVPAPPEGHGGWRKVFKATEAEQPKPKDQSQ